jgi:glycosyltransferase involved in cell wall biosynthesis
MKVIHVPFCFAPDTVGGTEVYVANLARDLQGLGVSSIVSAPSDKSRAYEVDGISVRRFSVSNKVTDVIQLYGPGDSLAATEFAKILDDERPDLVHLHALTWAVSFRLVQASKERGIPVVLTYHTPTVTCQRGTLLLWGKPFCDGKMELTRCTGCTLHGLGMNRSVAASIGRLPPKFGHWLGSHGMQGGIWTALRMSELIGARHDVIRKMLSEIDHIVAVCEWVKDVILLNGIPAAKVSLSRHGISWTPKEMAAPTPTVARQSSDEVWLAFVGRFDPTKGLHILLKALLLMPALKVRLDVYGLVQSSANDSYKKAMLDLAGRDPRIAFRNPIATNEIVPLLRQYDFLAIPSQWVETGPLVALEAFAAGIPVIGWNLGGTSEIVRHGVDGLLIDPASITGWADTLRLVVQNADLRAALKAGVRPPRTSIDVAREMLTLYQSLLGYSSTSAKKGRQSFIEV